MAEQRYTEVTMRVLFEGDEYIVGDQVTDLLNALGELEDEGHFTTGANIKINYNVRNEN